jgi:glycerol uptake facilitator-like aquaporin
LTAKQYFLVNFSKFIIEMVGTAFFTMFFYMMSGRFTAMLMAMWIITLFGLHISGSHFNPSVTMAQMLRRKTTFGKRRLLGVIYLVAQFSGGILGATGVALLLKEGSRYRINVMPASNECEYKEWSYTREYPEGDPYHARNIDCRYDIPSGENGENAKDEEDNEIPATENENKHWKTFESVVSETFGSFVYVLFFMISTDEKLRFSNDKV